MLPDLWIAKIFDQMSAMYGSKFADLWRGSDLATVRRVWAEKLAGFETMPGAIKEALAALDSKPFPPTLPEFLALCREAGTRHVQQRPMIEYKATPEEQERAKEAQRAVADTVKQMPERDHRAWIGKLLARKDKGEVIHHVAEQFARQAQAEFRA